LSALTAFLIPKEFQSTARLMPPDQVNSEMEMLASAATAKAGSGLGTAANSLLGLKSSGALFVGILQSRTVQDDIIGKLDLRKIYRVRYWGDARNELRMNTVVSEDRKSGIISLQVTDRDPQRAAAIAQQYVDELDRVVTQLNTSSAHRERVFLEERLTQVKQDLESAEKGFSEFASKNTAIDIQAQGKAMIEAAAALEGELVAAQTELQGLKQIYADGNVRVRATEARIAELQRQLQKIGGKSDAPALNNAQFDRSTIQPSIRQLPLLGVSYADLDRSAKVQEAIFETLTQEYELAKVEEAKETPSVKLIDPPDVPEKKSFPSRLLIISMGTFISLVGGVIWLLADGLWRDLEPHDPGKVLAQEVWQTATGGLAVAFRGGHGNGIKDAVFSASSKTGCPADLSP
jgi:capsule polysaccharide export protein KpsE/RkpR